MTQTLYQVHLKGKGSGFSRRGVRVRELGIDDVQRAKYLAAAAMGKHGTAAELSLRIDDECIKMMIVSVTKPVDTLDGGATWTKVTEEQLDGDGEFAFSNLFKVADMTVLQKLYNQISGVTSSDVDDIVGGQLTVSAD